MRFPPRIIAIWLSACFLTQSAVPPAGYAFSSINPAKSNPRLTQEALAARTFTSPGTTLQTLQPLIWLAVGALAHFSGHDAIGLAAIPLFPNKLKLGTTADEQPSVNIEIPSEFVTWFAGRGYPIEEIQARLHSWVLSNRSKLPKEVVDGFTAKSLQPALQIEIVKAAVGINYLSAGDQVRLTKRQDEALPRIETGALSQKTADWLHLWWDSGENTAVLTSKEKSVLNLLIGGTQPEEIARRLGKGGVPLKLLKVLDAMAQIQYKLKNVIAIRKKMMGSVRVIPFLPPKSLVENNPSPMHGVFLTGDLPDALDRMGSRRDWQKQWEDNLRHKGTAFADDGDPRSRGWRVVRRDDASVSKSDNVDSFSYEVVQKLTTLVAIAELVGGGMDDKDRMRLRNGILKPINGFDLSLFMTKDLETWLQLFIPFRPVYLFVLENMERFYTEQGYLDEKELLHELLVQPFKRLHMLFEQTLIVLGLKESVHSAFPQKASRIVTTQWVAKCQEKAGLQPAFISTPQLLGTLNLPSGAYVADLWSSPFMTRWHVVAGLAGFHVRVIDSREKFLAYALNHTDEWLPFMAEGDLEYGPTPPTDVSMPPIDAVFLLGIFREGQLASDLGEPRDRAETVRKALAIVKEGGTIVLSLPPAKDGQAQEYPEWFSSIVKQKGIRLTEKTRTPIASPEGHGHHAVYLGVSKSDPMPASPFGTSLRVLIPFIFMVGAVAAYYSGHADYAAAAAVLPHVFSWRGVSIPYSITKAKAQLEAKGVEFVVATSRDLNAIIQLRRKNAPEFQNGGAGENSLMHVLGEESQAQKDSFIVVAKYRGQIIGYGLSERDGHRAFLSELVVATPWRGQGVAKALMGKRIEESSQVWHVSEFAYDSLVGSPTASIARSIFNATPHPLNQQIIRFLFSLNRIAMMMLVAVGLAVGQTSRVEPPKDPHASITHGEAKAVLGELKSARKDAEKKFKALNAALDKIFKASGPMAADADIQLELRRALILGRIRFINHFSASGIEVDLQNAIMRLGEVYYRSLAWLPAADFVNAQAKEGLQGDELILFERDLIHQINEAVALLNSTQSLNIFLKPQDQTLQVVFGDKLAEDSVALHYDGQNKAGQHAFTETFPDEARKRFSVVENGKHRVSAHGLPAIFLLGLFGVLGTALQRRRPNLLLDQAGLENLFADSPLRDEVQLSVSPLSDRYSLILNIRFRHYAGQIVLVGDAFNLVGCGIMPFSIPEPVEVLRVILAWAQNQGFETGDFHPNVSKDPRNQKMDRIEEILNAMRLRPNRRPYIEDFTDRGKKYLKVILHLLDLRPSHGPATLQIMRAAA